MADYPPEWQKEYGNYSDKCKDHLQGESRHSYGRITLGFSEPEQLTQHKSKRLIEGFVCNPLCTPVMGMSLWGLSHLCETGILKEISIPNEISDWQSTRRRQLRWSDLGSNSKTKLEEIRIIV
ncbi:MAG: hypothetical protein ABL888_22555, partial [Pirellulaceae bacterium]